VRHEAFDRMTMARPRIALFGHFGVGNLGNEGSLDAMVRLVRQRFPDAEITVLCSNPAAVSARTGLAAVPWTRPEIRNGVLSMLNRLLLKLPYKAFGPIRAARILRGFDLVVVPGTGLLDDFAERPQGVPYVILKWALTARLVGCRFAMVCIGAGPIRHPLSRLFMMTAARAATYLSFRDEASRAFVARHVGRARSARVFPDIAFALPVPRLPDRPAGQQRIVAVGVMHYRGWGNGDGEIYARYIARLAQVVRTLIGRGCRVRLVIGEAGDVRAIADLRATLAESLDGAALRMIDEAPARDLDDVMRQLAGADAAVVTRFHNVVCALLVGTPVVSLSYGAKNDLLLKEMGLGHCASHVERFEPDWVIERLDEVQDDRAAIVARIAARVGAYRALLQMQARELHAMIAVAPSTPVALAVRDSEARP
jgi:polysaccharide pyruvyl transferase WcaK-like protein